MERAQPREGGGWTGARLEKAEFRRLATFIEGHCGIRMPTSKRVMLESRLRKRLRSLGLPTFREYCDLALDDPHPPLSRA